MKEKKADEPQTKETLANMLKLFYAETRKVDGTLCYPPQPSASADNTNLSLDNSCYHAQPHPIIVNSTHSMINMDHF